MQRNDNSYIRVRDIVDSDLKYFCYYMDSDLLCEMTELSLKEIDAFLLENTDIPITKYKEKGGCLYYVFPIEPLVMRYFEPMPE